MPNYVHHCPNCRSSADDIGMFSSHFEIYECGKCEERYCHRCDGSNNGRQCPHCGNDGYPSTVGRVAKG